jgi:hypothetical protein
MWNKPEDAPDAEIAKLFDDAAPPLTQVRAQIDPRIPVLVLARALASEGLVIVHNYETQQLYITETEETRASRERCEAFQRQLDASAHFWSGPIAEAARKQLLDAGIE